MFTNYMPYNSKTKAFVAWRTCLQKSKELRKKLSLPKDIDEDKHVCKKYYKAYMNGNNRVLKIDSPN